MKFFDYAFTSRVIGDIGVEDYECVLSGIYFDDGEVVVSFKSGGFDRATSVDRCCCVELSMSNATFQVELAMRLL